MKGHEKQNRLRKQKLTFYPRAGWGVARVAVIFSSSVRPCVIPPCLSLLQEALGAGPQKAKEEEK